MHIEMKQKVCMVGANRAIPHKGTYGLLYFIKHKNDMHTLAALQKL